MSKNTICSNCGAIINNSDETYSIYGDTICEACAKDTIICERCGDRIWADDNAGNDGIHLCQRCYDNHYTSCESCGAIIHQDHAHYDDDDDYPYCDECYDEKCGSIHCYSYKPRPLFYGNDNRFFGVELEIDKGGQNSYNADRLLDIANEDKELLYIKRDGSLDCGMELVTHPMTLEFHKTEMPWETIMKKAVNLAYRSHKTDTCGLHVHVNRTTFGESRELQDERISRVLYFVEHHWEELLKFSRRTEEQMNQWAARYGYKNSPGEVLEHAKKCGKGRYACVNITNYETIEFRMFRGTLKYNTLIAAIQLVDIICEYACTFSDNEIKAISWTDFVGGIDKDEYQELITYLKEHRLYVNEPVDAEEDD